MCGAVLFLLIFAVSVIQASDTMLMFVGEDLEVISIASRKEEAASKAPAIVRVMTRETMDQTQVTTIAEALAESAGFSVEQTEKGSVPYLRGIQDSALFLYDTVPMGSGAYKSFHLIDHETSLAPVKRIEIVRGAGSVLWGPDAFAGVVNAVPLTGKDLQGFETGARVSSDDEARDAYLNYGCDQGPWDLFFSLSGRVSREDDTAYNVVSFWDEGGGPAAPEDRFGQEMPADSRYVELYSSVSFKQWLTLSARLSDNTKHFSVSDGADEFVWEERLSAPTETFKLELSKDVDLASKIRLTGYYTQTRLHHEIIDREFDPAENSVYAELIYDRSMFTSNGLLTAGISQRKTKFSDIPVWKGFFPDYLDEDNLYFTPEVETVDYENDLSSVFGQYRHKFKNVELWAGVRNDRHDRFEDKISYNFGGLWDLYSDWVVKSAYGTAYRTPFAAQVAEQEDILLEKIDSLNFQVAWKPDKKRNIGLTLFQNRIENHVIEDRYAGAGLSIANRQTIYGAELECDFKLLDGLSLSGNLTVLDNTGPDETYLYNDYSYVDSDGSRFDHYQQLDYGYNTGSDVLFNARAEWDVTGNIRLIPEVHYFSERAFYNPVEDVHTKCSGAWTMDLNARIRNLFPFEVDVFVKNLADTRYETPGLYSVISGNAFNAGVAIKMKW